MVSAEELVRGADSEGTMVKTGQDRETFKRVSRVARGRRTHFFEPCEETLAIVE